MLIVSLLVIILHFIRSSSASLTSANKIFKISAEHMNMTRNNNEDMPFVTVAFAQTLDGSIAPIYKRRLNISSVGSFQLLHSLRSQHDAVLVGFNTISIDKPRLNVRNPLPGHSGDSSKKPRAVILDTHLKIASSIHELQVHRPVICTCVQPFDDLYLTVQAKLALIGGDLISCKSNINGRVDIHECLKLIHDVLDIKSVLVEGGANILQDFFSYAELISQVLVSIQPSFLGGYRSMTKELIDPLSLSNVYLGSVEGNILVYGRVEKTENLTHSIEDGFSRDNLRYLADGDHSFFSDDL
jgi:GTP cyclohydrolase II